MKKTKPRSEAGYYCDLCNVKLCKTSQELRKQRELRKCIFVQIGNDLEVKDICHDCAKEIAVEVIDDY